MQLNINIEDTNLQEQISRYLLDKKQKTDEFLLEAIKNLFQKEEEQKPLMSKKEIAKTVNNSQRIEGYEPVSEEYELEVEAFMKENNLEISA